MKVLQFIFIVSVEFLGCGNSFAFSPPIEQTEKEKAIEVYNELLEQSISLIKEEGDCLDGSIEECLLFKNKIYYKIEADLVKTNVLSKYMKKTAHLLNEHHLFSAIINLSSASLYLGKASDSLGKASDALGSLQNNLNVTPSDQATFEDEFKELIQEKIDEQILFFCSAYNFAPHRWVLNKDKIKRERLKYCRS